MRIAVTCVVAVLVFALVVTCGGFAWLRWFAHDDAADMQGTWYLAGTEVPIVISDESIRLNEDVAYQYTIDKTAKTVQFSFKSLSGAGCYRFALDRDQLVFVDGDYSALDTLVRDAGWTFQALVGKARGEEVALMEEAPTGMTFLTRTPNTDAATSAG